MTSQISDFNDDMLDDETADEQDEKLESQSQSQRQNNRSAGVRHKIDTYLENRKLKAELKDLFEDDFFDDELLYSE